MVFVNDRLVPRAQAMVSVWDAGFQHGDGVYEGIRVYNGKIFRLHEHVARLFECADALGIRIPMSREEMAVAIARTVHANNLVHDTHIRVQATRGLKRLTGMDPELAAVPHATVVVMAEPKKPTLPKGGMTLITSSIRRTPADCLDPKLHTCNQLGQIMAKMEANHAGADEALMLDTHGFVAETNSANVFVVKGKRVSTSTRNACMPGLTREFVLELAERLGYQAREEDLSLSDVYRADEMFVCGTVCEIAPVTGVDGRRIGSGQPGPVTERISEAYLKVAGSEGVPVDTLVQGAAHHSKGA